jgi:hypothetical protein
MPASSAMRIIKLGDFWFGFKVYGKILTGVNKIKPRQKMKIKEFMRGFFIIQITSMNFMDKNKDFFCGSVDLTFL